MAINIRIILGIMDRVYQYCFGLQGLECEAAKPIKAKTKKAYFFLLSEPYERVAALRLTNSTSYIAAQDKQ
jgi:hypothetical protein